MVSPVDPDAPFLKKFWPFLIAGVVFAGFATHLGYTLGCAGDTSTAKPDQLWNNSGGPPKR